MLHPQWVEAGSPMVAVVRLLGEAYRDLMAATTEDEVLHALVESVRRTFGADIAACARRRDDALGIVAHTGLRHADLPSRWRLQAGEGVGGGVLLNGQPALIRDYRRDPRRIANMKGLIDQEGVRSAMVAPMRVGDDVDGIVYVASRQADRFGAEELSLLSEFVVDAGVCLERASERERLHGHLADVEESLRAFEETDRVRDEVLGALLDEEGLPQVLLLAAGHLGVGLEVTGAGGGVIATAGRLGGGPGAAFELGAGEKVLGTLRAFAPGPLPQQLHHALEQLAGVISLELHRQRAVAETRLRVEGSFVVDLVRGRGDVQRLLDQAALLGMDLARPRVALCFGAHAAALVAATETGFERRIVKAVEQSVEELAEPLVTLHGDTVVVVALQPEGGQEAVVRQVEAVRARAGARCRIELDAGVGSACETLRDVPGSYREAALALRLQRQHAEPGVRTADQLGVYALLAQAVAPESLEALASDRLRPLRELDEKTGGAHLETLRAYLLHDCHMERTAKALHLHVNTLRYRLRRVETALGLDLRDADEVEERFALELALRLDAALAGRGPLEVAHNARPDLGGQPT